MYVVPKKLEIPREYLGAARAYRRRLAAEDIPGSAALDSIIAPLRTRARKGRPPRPETVIDTARAWRERVGECGRLDLEIDAGKTSLHIRDLRVSAAQNTFDCWRPGDSEDGLCVMLLQLRSDSKLFQFNNLALAGISLHALARRFQRAFDTSDVALRRDFRALADAAAADDPLALRGEFRIPAPAGDGLWVGASTVVPEGAGHQRILSVRSFITE